MWVGRYVGGSAAGEGPVTGVHARPPATHSPDAVAWWFAGRCWHWRVRSPSVAAAAAAAAGGDPASSKHVASKDGQISGTVRNSKRTSTSSAKQTEKEPQAKEDRAPAKKVRVRHINENCRPDWV